MSIPISLSTLATARDPLTPGQIVLGRIDGAARYGVAVAAAQDGLATRFLLYSKDGEVLISDASPVTWQDGAISVGSGNDLKLRVSSLEPNDGAKRLEGILQIDDSEITVAGRMIGAKLSTPTFVGFRDWRILHDKNVGFAGSFRSSEWQLVHVDDFGREVVVLDARREK